MEFLQSFPLNSTAAYGILTTITFNSTSVYKILRVMHIEQYN